MSLLSDSLTQPVIEIPADASLASRCQSVVDPASRWQIYLHELGWAAIAPWLQDSFEEAPQLWPKAAPWDIWQIVSGLALSIGQRRIVVIISEAIDTAELRIAKEWVDIPDWAGDYYLAAQIDVDEQQLRLWGYTTHAQIKQQGAYDEQDRTYCLSEASLVQDFSAFWVAYQLEKLEARATDSVTEASLSKVPRVQADNLITRLADALEPRLEIPFGLWGTLLQDQNWRRAFYAKRQRVYQLSVQSADQMLAAGWQVLSSLLPSAPVANFRADTLTGNNRQPVTSYGKTVALTTEKAAVDLVLAVSWKVEADNRSNIQIQLYPAKQMPVEGEGDRPILPAAVLLILQAETGEALQTVCSGDRDNYIQLPAFRCGANQPFSICVQYASAVAVTHFLS